MPKPFARRKWIIVSAILLVIAGSLAGYRVYRDHLPVPHSLPSGIHPVVCDNGLLGGTLNGKVVNSDVMAAQLAGRMVFRCYAQSGFRGLAVSKVGEIPSYFEMLNERVLPRYDVAISGNWNPLPRPVKKLAPTADDKTAVAGLLLQKHLKHPIVRITEALAADLDGDGVVEHIIGATTPTPDYIGGGLGCTSAGADDYSVALVIRSPEGIPAVEVLDGDFHTKHDSCAVEFHLRGVYDVDGDGQMEVLVDYQSSEEMSGTEVYDVTATKARESKMLVVWGD